LKIPKVLFIIVFIIFQSCRQKGKTETTTELQKDSTEITHEFIEVSKKINDNTVAEYEYVVSKNDSFLNQTKIYKNGILDTLQSRFYDLNIIKNDGLNHSGHIYYRNYLDTLKLEINKDRWVFFYLEQRINKDSTAHKIFCSKDGNNIYYEYSDFENGHISGYIEDTALFPVDEKDSTGQEMTRQIEQPMNIQKRIEINKKNVLQHRI